MLQFDPSQYLNKAQIGQLYVRRPEKPQPPKAIALADSGIVLTPTDQYAYLTLDITPPDRPPWLDSGVTYIQSYEVQYTANGVALSHLFPASDPVRLDGLIPGVAYQIQARAIDYVGQASDFTQAEEFDTPLDTVPPAKPGLTVLALDVGAQVLVNPFNNEPDFAGYDLYRDTDPNLKNDPHLLPCRTFDSTETMDVSLPADGNYYYYLVARDFSGNKTASDVFGPVALKATTMPTPATISLADATAVPNPDGSITFTFDKSTDQNLKSYNIYRKRTGADSWVILGSLLPPADNPDRISYVDTTPISGFEYHYAVTAVNTNADESAIDTAHDVKATAAATEPPAPPAGSIQYAGAVGSINVTWAGSPDPRTVFYLVHWRYQQAGTYSEWNEGVLVEGTSYLLNGLTDPETGLPPTRDALANLFEVEIAAVDAYNNTSAFVARLDTQGHRVPVQYPELYAYRPADNSIPPAPALVLNSDYTPKIDINNDGSVTLYWNPPNITDLYGFLIEDLRSDHAEWESLHTVVSSDLLTKQFTVTGLEPYNFNHRTYRFRVRSIDNTQNVTSINMLDSPSFDTGIGDWSQPTGGVTQLVNDPTLVRNGVGQAVRMNYNGRIAQAQPCIVGEQYTFSAYVRKDTSNSASVARVRADYQLADGTVIAGTTTTYTINLSDVYQRAVVTLPPAPANAVLVQVTPDTDPNNPDQTAVWDDTQLELGSMATTYGDGKTDYVRAVDLSGPASYNAQLSVVGQWGYFQVNWVNGTDSSYVNCTYEIWRKLIASDKPGFVPDPDFLKVIEVPGTNDGRQNGWSDDRPDETEHLTAQYALRPRDRFGNAATDAQGNPVFLATSGQVTSLNTNDQNIIVKDGLAPDVPVIDHYVANLDSSITVYVRESSTHGRNDLAGYSLWRKATGADPATYVRVNSLNCGTGSGMVGISDTPALGAAYDYAVSAFDTQGDESNRSTDLTNISPVDYRPVAPVSNLVAVAGIGSITFTWNPSPSPGDIVYELNIPALGGVIAATDIQVKGTSATVMLPLGPQANWIPLMLPTVTAIRNGSGVRSTAVGVTSYDTSNYVVIDTTAPDPPGVPTVVSLTPTQLVLTWVSSPSPDVAKYVVETNVAGDWYAVASAMGPSKGCLITGLNQGQAYQFRVWAIDYFNNTSQPSPVSAPITIPTAPPQNQPPQQIQFTGNNTGLSADNQTAWVSLTWQQSPDSDFAYYQLSVDGGAAFTVSTSKTQVSYQVNALSQGVNHSFVVRVVDTGGLAGPWSNTLNVTTPVYTPPPIDYTPTLSLTDTGSEPNDGSLSYTGEDYELTFGGNRYSDFKQYNIYRSLDQSTWTLKASWASAAPYYSTENATSQAHNVYFQVEQVSNSGQTSPRSHTVQVHVAVRYIDSGGDGGCYGVEMFLLDDVLAGDAHVGLEVDGVSDDLQEKCKYPIQTFERVRQHCVRLYSDNGAEVVISSGTHIVLEDDSRVEAWGMEGKRILTDVGNGLEWSTCHVEHLGWREVAKIFLGGHSYRAAKVPGKWMYTHNVGIMLPK